MTTDLTKLPEGWKPATFTHTPGPWKTGFIMNGDRWVGPDYDQPKVCRIEDEREECDANARLIAAAPDLLEALKQAVDAIAAAKQYLPNAKAIGANYSAWQAAMDAIAKAEGRS